MFGSKKKGKIEEESLENILKEVDKESNVRVLTGFKKHLMTGLLVAFAHSLNFEQTAVFFAHSPKKYIWVGIHVNG